MDPTQQTASDYYHTHRKRSLFSRITIFSSMVVLIIVLAINVSALYSHEQNTIKSNASTPENIQNLLPSLPSGCYYRDVYSKITIQCPKVTATITVSVPINVPLPQLPPQCSMVTSSNGSAVKCTALTTPIPTVPVSLPSTCTVGKAPETVNCTDKNNKTVTVPLPSIPDGCSYVLDANKYYVVCEAK